MNLAKLNHILIPSTKAGRDRLRRTRIGRFFEALGWAYWVLSREGKVLLVIAILAGFFGLEVTTRQSYLVWCGLTGLLVASLMIRRTFRLDGVSLGVHAPPMVSVGEEVTFELSFENEGELEHQAIEVDGPLLPWDGQYTSSRSRLARLEAHARATVTTTARFAARGEHHLDPFTARALVPFGLTTGPALASEGSRFLVVPTIAPIAALRTPLVRRYQPGGVALASRTGESMELLGLRPYRPGDPIRDLHARRWARLGSPVVREYQQEYFTRIGVVVDTDQRIADEVRLEAALSLAAGVVAHLSRGETLIDLLVVGDQLHRLTLGRSLGCLDQALELLAMVEPGPPLSASRLTARLSPHLEQLSCVVLITLDWDPERQQLVQTIRTGGVGCRVLGVTRDRDADYGEVGVADLTEISVKSVNLATGLVL